MTLAAYHYFHYFRRGIIITITTLFSLAYFITLSRLRHAILLLYFHWLHFRHFVSSYKYILSYINLIIT